MTIRGTLRSVRLSAAERRASIVEAACKLFSEKGFRGTTTRELAAAVGVTEPVLYEHFRTKNDLYRAIIEVKTTQGENLLSDLATRHRETCDDRAFFEELAVAIARWYCDDPAFIRLLLFSNLEGHELKDLFHERSCEFFQVVAWVIERRQQEGAMRQDVDPMTASRAFFGMIAHYGLTAMVFGVHPLPSPPAEVARHMADLFLNGLTEKGKAEK